MPQTDLRADVGATASTTSAQTGTTPAVTQPAGNAAAVEAAGLATTDTAEDDGVLDDIVGGMLVLLPLGAALPCAWSLRTLPQVRDWLASIGMGEVLDAAPEFAMDLVDRVFPDGSSLTTGLDVDGAAAMTGGWEQEYALAREGSSFTFTLRGFVDVGVAAAEGGELKGAGGTALAEAMAELGCSGATGVEATWELPIGDTVLPETLYRCALDLDRLDLTALLRDVAAAVDELIVVARPVALQLRTSVEATAEAGVDASIAVGPGTDLAGVKRTAEAEAAIGMGYDSDGAYVELSVSASGEVRGWAGLSNLLEAYGCPLGDLVGKAGIAVRVRAKAATELLQAAIATGFADPAGITFEVGITTTWGDSTTEEVAQVDTLGGVASYLLAAASTEDAADVLDRWETCAEDAVGGATLPEVGLERSMTLTLHEATQADALLPEWAEIAAALLPDHGVLTGVTARTLEGRVRVGSDAVRALLGDPSYAVPPTEEEVVDLERILLDAAVATASTGGLATTPWEGRDLSRVADLVHFDALELVAEATFEVGGGFEAAEAAKVELEGTATTTVARRMEVSGQTQAELAEKLA